MADLFGATLVSADENVNTVTNQMFVQLTDGTTGITNTGSSLNVAVTDMIPGTGATNIGKAESSTHTSGDVGIEALGVRQDSVSVLAADGEYIPFSMNSSGDLRVTLDGESLTITNVSVKVDDTAFAVASDSVTAIGFLADETSPDSVDEGDIGIPRMTLDRKVLTRIVGASDADRWDIDSSGHGQVDLAAVSVTAVPVSKDGSANSSSNPIFVQTVNTGTSSTEIHDYDTATVAGSGTSNHDYTVANTTFFLRQVLFSSSGGGKAEIQTGPVAGLVTQAVIFVPKQGGSERWTPPVAVEVPVASTGTVRVIRTNREGASQDLYSTIVGDDV